MCELDILHDSLYQFCPELHFKTTQQFNVGFATPYLTVKLSLLPNLAVTCQPKREQT